MKEGNMFNFFKTNKEDQIDSLKKKYGDKVINFHSFIGQKLIICSDKLIVADLMRTVYVSYLEISSVDIEPTGLKIHTTSGKKYDIPIVTNLEQIASEIMDLRNDYLLESKSSK